MNENGRKALTAGLLRAVNATFGGMDGFADYLSDAGEPDGVKGLQQRRLVADLPALVAIRDYLAETVGACEHVPTLSSARGDRITIACSKCGIPMKAVPDT